MARCQQHVGVKFPRVVLIICCLVLRNSIVPSVMNLFKRALSTTARATGANDQQNPQSSSNIPQTTPSDTPSPTSDIPIPLQSSSNYASNPAFSRKITYSTHEEPTPLFYPFVFVPLCTLSFNGIMP